MKNLIFIENFDSHFNIPQGDIISLNVSSHYELLIRKIKHFTISDIINFKSFLNNSESYNNYQKKFFNNCDEPFHNIKINQNVAFSPFRILGYEFKFIFDSLISQSIIISEIINNFKPRKIFLLTSYRPINNKINYIDIFKKTNYEYLNYEILKHFSYLNNYEFENIVVTKSFSNRLTGIKEFCKKEIKNNKLYTYYRQSLTYKNINNEKINEECLTFFNFCKGNNNLFVNQGWGLNKLLEMSLISNKRTFVLENGFLFIYNKSKITNYLYYKSSETMSLKMANADNEKEAESFNIFVQDTFNINLHHLITNRLHYINRELAPNLLQECFSINNMLNKYRIENIFGNMKTDKQQFIIAYIATYDLRFKYIYFTHGYDIYDVDRTYLELPCNVYFTVDEEYKNYFQTKFNSQDFYIKPAEVLVNPL